MAKQQTAFVIMPIKKIGSDEYQHFRSLYDEVLKPCLESCGYEARRADDVQKTGAITRDIILRLAESDLVLADLTDLNPNVFYELGVRHALRGAGTVMLLDEIRTTDVPFDLSAYRVIKFRGELNGIGRLRTDLAAFLKGGADAIDRRDNPVHDWLPVLPINSLEAAAGTTEGKLREQLADAQRLIRQYEKIAGALPGGAKTPKRTALETIDDALRDAKEGNLGYDLLEAAQRAVDQRDRKEFLAVLRRIMDRTGLGLRSKEYRLLAGMCQHLGLSGDITGAVLAHGLAASPKDQELKQLQLSLLAHSHDAEDRRQAREELATIVGVTITGEKVEPPKRVTDDQLSLFGIMLDTYHADGLEADALRIAEAFATAFPQYTTVCRNLARALESCGRLDEAWEWYKKAITVPDAADSSAVWYGNTLHNIERHVDAMEAYLVACRLDPHDGVNFAHVAEEMSHAWADGIAHATKGRPLPLQVNAVEDVQAFVAAAVSCRSVDHECLTRCRSAIMQAELPPDEINLFFAGQHESQDMSEPESAPSRRGMRHMGLVDRVTLANGLYELVKSDVSVGDSHGAIDSRPSSRK